MTWIDLEIVMLHVCVLSCGQQLLPARLLRPWNFPGKDTGVGCHFLLQGIFPTQGSNPGLLHCRQTLYRLSHQGSFLPWESSSVALIIAMRADT